MDSDQIRTDTNSDDTIYHIISNSDANTNIIEYEYKTNISNSDSHSNTYSIYIMSINFICGWFCN
jgi:ATP/ADP translocase